MAEACGVEGGVSYILWNRNELKHLVDLSTVVDSDVYYFSEEFVFPNDEDGMQGVIIYRKEIANLEQDEPYWRHTSVDEKWYKWSGFEMQPKFNN